MNTLSSSRASMIAIALLTAVASVAACGGGDSASSSSSSSASQDEVEFHGKSELFPNFKYATGLLPEGSPVQASFSLGASGSVSVVASATPSGSASSPELTGVPGTGDLELHGGITFQGELKVQLTGLPSYDGPIPGIENLNIAIDGKDKFDPFAMKTQAKLHAAIPAKKLPPIPLPGGIPGNLVFSIAPGSFVDLALTGSCADVEGGEAHYTAHVDRAGTLVLQPEIDIDFPGVAPVMLPQISVDLALGGSDFVMEAKVLGYAKSAPEGETSKVACKGASGAGGGATTSGGDGGGGGNGGDSSSGPSSSSGAGASTSSSSSQSSSSASSSSSGGGQVNCSLYDDDVDGCNATHRCAYFFCSRTCWDFGTQLDVGCGPGLECDSATVLADVRGDAGADVDNATGNETHWFRFKLDEVASGASPLRYTVTLREPAGAHYELYVHEGSVSDDGCGAMEIEGNGIPLEIGRDIPTDGSHDATRFVSIEIRHVSGVSSANWSLSIAGNR